MPHTKRDSETVQGNLHTLDRRIARQAEKYIPWLTELAVADSRRLSGRTEPVADVLRELGRTFAGPVLHDECLFEQGAPLLSALGGVRAALIPSYIRPLCAGAGLGVSDFLPLLPPGGGKIAYARNAYTDEAYEKFARLFADPRAFYTESFRASPEEVAGKEADFCILPYENATGFLAGFAAMAKRHRLVCVATCRVLHADGADATHFALYGRAFRSPDRWRRVCLRYAFPYRGEAAFAAHMAALGALGGGVDRLQCEAEEEGGGTACTVTARLTETDLVPWLAYLAIFEEGYKIYGLYRGD